MTVRRAMLLTDGAYGNRLFERRKGELVLTGASW